MHAVGTIHSGSSTPPCFSYSPSFFTETLLLFSLKKEDTHIRLCLSKEVKKMEADIKTKKKNVAETGEDVESVPRVWMQNWSTQRQREAAEEEALRVADRRSSQVRGVVLEPFGKCRPFHTASFRMDFWTQKYTLSPWFSQEEGSWRPHAY